MIESKDSFDSQLDDVSKLHFDNEYYKLII